MNPRLPGDAELSARAGAIAGAVGGALALAIADAMVSHARFVEHTRVALEGRWSLALEGAMLVRVGILLAAVFGAILGAFLGRLTRRLSPLGARLVFDAVLVAALCTILYAYVVPRYAPALAHVIPFAAAVLGALAYGVCVALAPPVRARRMHAR